VRTWFPIVVFGVLWLDLIRLLSPQWEAREQYAYGWFVPFFAAALLWRRWSDRPGSEHRSQQSAVSSPVARGLVVSGLVVLLPLRVIYEINTDWPLISWLYTLIVIAATLYAFSLAGGWPWVRHFAFPVSFILVAVVWPYRIEKGLTQGLMRVVASLTVELLGWLDIPALQRGNLIELGTGTVGIDEACSGIRSFQSSLMAALLMGELYRFRLWPRAALVAIGITLGFCFNIVRTLLLGYQANQQGLDAIKKWHDPAGLTITVACFFCLWAIAVLLKKRTTGPRDHGTTAPVSSPVVPSPISHLPSPTPRRFLQAVGLWSILCIGATEAWYRSHTPKDSGVFHWSVALPETKPGFQKVELAPRSVRMLAYDFSTTGKWREEDGSEWSLLFFRWLPRSVESVIYSRVHRPEVCLQASGFKQVSDSKLIWVEASGLKLPFRKYLYEMEGRKLFVFFCQWEDGSEEQKGMQASSQADCLQSVLKGRRLVGQQTLEIIITGCTSLDEAERQVRQHLPPLIRIEVPNHQTLEPNK
jgi:exosortase